MEKRIALIGIIVEDIASASEVNDILHEYGDYIVGRMGIPYRKRSINVISIVIDAELDVINSLSGKLGKTSGISVKTVCTKN